jgi:hypothetical protein
MPYGKFDGKIENISNTTLQWLITGEVLARSMYVYDRHSHYNFRELDVGSWKLSPNAEPYNHGTEINPS